MNLNQLAQTIELLQQKFIAQRTACDKAVNEKRSSAEIEALNSKIKKTTEEIKLLNKEYQEKFYSGIESFDRKKASSF